METGGKVGELGMGAVSNTPQTHMDESEGALYMPRCAKHPEEKQAHDASRVGMGSNCPCRTAGSII